MTPHAVYLALGLDQPSRQQVYRGLFQQHFDPEVQAAIRLGVQQSQPVGNPRFLDMIEQMTGQRRGPKPRGRPRKPMPPEG